MRFALFLAICLFAVWIQRNECLRWERRSALNGFRSTNPMEEISFLRKFDCAVICSKTAYCVAFIHVPQESTNCQLFRHVTTSTNGLVASTDATYYALATDIDGFMTKKLSPGQSITFKIVTSIANHADATHDCENMGGYLVRISTATKLNFLQNLIQSTSEFKTNDYFVGGSNVNASDITDVNQWKYNNGESLPASLWTEPYPDSKVGGYHCVQMYRGAHWNFDDTSCSLDTNNYYICEK